MHEKNWRSEVSILVPYQCYGYALPFELYPLWLSLSLYIYNTYHLSVRLLIEMYLYRWYVTMDNFNLFLNKLDY